MRGLMGWVVAVALAGCGGSDDGDSGADGAGSGSAATSAGTDPSAGSGDGTSMGSAGSGGTGPFNGACDGNLPFAIADSVDLMAMDADAVRQETEGDTVPLYIVQVHGSDTGADRLDIIFRGEPQLDMPYSPFSPPGTGPGPSWVGLYPSTDDAHAYDSGSLTFSQVGVADGEILAAEFDFTFAGGTVAGCFSLPLTVEFVAPP